MPTKKKGQTPFAVNERNQHSINISLFELFLSELQGDDIQEKKSRLCASSLRKLEQLKQLYHFGFSSTLLVDIIHFSPVNSLDLICQNYTFLHEKFGLLPQDMMELVTSKKEEFYEIVRNPLALIERVGAAFVDIFKNYYQVLKAELNKISKNFLLQEIFADDLCQEFTIFFENVAQQVEESSRKACFVKFNHFIDFIKLANTMDTQLLATQLSAKVKMDLLNREHLGLVIRYFFSNFTMSNLIFFMPISERSQLIPHLKLLCLCIERMHFYYDKKNTCLNFSSLGLLKKDFCTPLFCFYIIALDSFFKLNVLPDMLTPFALIEIRKIAIHQLSEIILHSSLDRIMLKILDNRFLLFSNEEIALYAAEAKFFYLSQSEENKQKNILFLRKLTQFFLGYLCRDWELLHASQLKSVDSEMPVGTRSLKRKHDLVAQRAETSAFELVNKRQKIESIMPSTSSTVIEPSVLNEFSYRRNLVPSFFRSLSPALQTCEEKVSGCDQENFSSRLSV